MKPSDCFETMGKTLSEAEILDFAYDRTVRTARLGMRRLF